MCRTGLRICQRLAARRAEQVHGIAHDAIRTQANKTTGLSLVIDGVAQAAQAERLGFGHQSGRPELVIAHQRHALQRLRGGLPAGRQRVDRKSTV